MHPPSKNIALVVNPLAGSGSSVKVSRQAADYLLSRAVPYTLFQQEWPRDFNSYSDVWLVGGDGTLNYFINHYPDLSIPITILPGGSGNDFNWLLFGHKTLQEMMKAGLDAVPRRIDVGCCNGRYFVNGIGIGFDGSIARKLMRKNKQPGIASYWTAVIGQLFFYREQYYSIKVDGQVISGKKLMLNFMNGQRSGGGFWVAPGADPADGFLQALLVEPLSLWNRARYLPVIEKGGHTRLPFVSYFLTTHIEVSGHKPMDAHLDGEYLSAAAFEISLLPGKLSFRY